MASHSRLVLAAALVLLAGCDKPQSIGDANAVLAVLPTQEWPRVEAGVEAALEERAFTVRDERIFRVTHVDPASREWGDLRRFRQILVIGRPGDAWMEDAIGRVRGPLPALPTVAEARDVWAQNQLVTLVVLPEGAPFEAAEPLLPAVGERFLRRFQVYAHQRMFASGTDSVLADSLGRAHGFSLLLPNVYYGRQIEPNAFVFRNDHPDPSQLIRSVLVTWQEGGTRAADPGAVRQWREQLAERYFDPAQVTEAEITSRPMEAGVVQVQGIWSNPPGEWPAAGLFITRQVPCPQQNRTYLVDSWLYAPGRDKYEYLLQLAAILDSFRCTGAAPAGS